MTYLIPNVLSHGRPVIQPQSPSSGGPIQLRDYQIQVVKETARNALVVQPTGAGKSVTMLTIAALRRQNGLSTVILVPKLGIASGFKKYTDGRNFTAVDHDHNPVAEITAGTVYEPKAEKCDEIIRVLNGGPAIVVCSYQAFQSALATVINDSPIRLTDDAMGRLKVLLDEAHHCAITVDPDGEVDQSRRASTELGKAVHHLCQLGVAIYMFTATDYRTDRLPLIPPTHKDQFTHVRRTLAQHFSDGLCPDFDIDFTFYDQMTQQERNAAGPELNGDFTVFGKLEALLDAYVRQYKLRPLPTLMVLPATLTKNQREQYPGGPKRFAYQLAQRLAVEFPDAAVLNMGSEDGEELVSITPGVQEKFDRLNRGERFDIVTALKTFDEGVDWVDCCQVFLPSVPNSIQLIVQRLGRALRRKGDGHPSPDLSHLHFFEVGIRDEDKSLVTRSTVQLALRLKCLCRGINFAPTIDYPAGEGDRKVVDDQKAAARDKVDAQTQHEIDECLNAEASQGASAAELVTMAIAAYKEQGVELSPLATVELLVAKEIVALSEKNAERLNARHSVGLYLATIDARDLIDVLTVEGIDRYVKMLAGEGTGDIKVIIARMLRDSWDQQLAELSNFASQHGRPPTRGENSGCAKWCTSQRMHKDELSDEQRSALEGVPGWHWDNFFDAKWDEALKRFAAVISGGGKVEYGSSAHNFLGQVRTARRKGTLRKDREGRLQALPGFPGWDDSPDAKWDKRFDEIAMEVQEGRTTFTGRDPSAMWFKKQRGAVSKGEIDQCKADRLRSLPIWIEPEKQETSE